MQQKKVQSILSNLDIIGLSNNDLNELALWYAYFTNRKSKNNYSKNGEIIDEKNAKKGLVLFGNILSNLDNFENPLNVEPLTTKHRIGFKCTNKNGEKLVVVFSHGDWIDFPTVISVISRDNVKYAKIMLDKGIVFDKLSLYDTRTLELNEYYNEIYDSAYNQKENEETKKGL